MSTPKTARKIKCSVCGQAAAPEYQPFCSKRCADIDLGKWLSGSYVIQGIPGDDEHQDHRDGPDGDDPEED